ncbi:mucoidy inhibitor MuiA family protein [Nannocystaceae bacterium ST9]
MTVYRRGALVTREALLDADATQVELEGLPLTLDDASLRVSVEAIESSGGVPIASDVRVTIAVPSGDPSLPAPNDAELEAAQLELAQATLASDRLQRSLDSLSSLEPGPRGQAKAGRSPASSPMAARLELLGFRRERGEALLARLAESHERVRLARERLATLQERVRVASQARNVRTWEVRKAAVIRLEPAPRAERASRVRLRLSYFVPGARWAPAYTVRLDRSMSAGTLELRAMVGQSSGEDWTNVALTLSTASPQQWTELPELRAQKIGRAQPEPSKTGWRPPPIGAGELYADFDRDLAGARPQVRSSPPARPQVHAPEPAPHGRQLEERAAEQAKDEVSATRRGGAMPTQAMPVAAAPMPEYMPMPASRSKGRPSVVGAIVGGAIGGIAAMFEGAGGGGYDAPAEPELERELLAGRELLDYGRLRMFAADDVARRGSLRKIDRRALYRQLGAAGLDLALAFDQLDAAIGAASSFDQVAAPARHRFPIDEAGFDYAYVADAAIDLASDGKFHALALRADAVEATPRYVAVPRETQDVFRIVALLNPLSAPLLAGPADVYVAGRFALTSDLETTPIGGRIELGLGVEQAIKIARNVHYGEDSSGLLKRQQALQHTLEIEVGNNLARTARVEIRERLSIAAEDQAGDIQIALREVSPAWDDYEQKQQPIEGGKLWTIEVPAGETRKLRASWVITIPNQHELIGGNRRES